MHFANPAPPVGYFTLHWFSVCCEIGLFTLNGFKKRIEDLVFFSKQYLTDLSAYPDLPQGGAQLFEFNTYVKNPNPVDVYGIETEWQTHFWYLPQPFSGLVLNVNYTHVYSKATYPRTQLDNVYDDEGNLTQDTTKDASYTTRLLNQPNDIVNVTLGFDYEGFSARISMLYQDNIFKQPDFWMQNRVFSEQYMRWRTCEDITPNNPAGCCGLLYSGAYFNSLRRRLISLSIC